MTNYNLILDTDSYKFSHYAMYPDYVKGMYGYIEARSNSSDMIVPFGLQMWIQKYLTQPITIGHIDEAESFATGHGVPFNRKGWEKIVHEYAGYLPITITAVPEGTPVPCGVPIVAVECTDPDLFWLASYIETSLHRAVWYPTTIASNDYNFKKKLHKLYEQTGADVGLIPFALHDFGARGVTSLEQSEIGGAAHLVNFMGSDTVAGVVAANKYYYHDMAGFSVPASEHSVECSFGVEGEVDYLKHVINTFAKPGGIVSIVIDGYNVYGAAKTLCTELKDLIIASGCKVVFRPDSGEMLTVVPKLLQLQEDAFGSTINSKGFRKINHVGVIQGDGVGYTEVLGLLTVLAELGFSADNVVFGSGGGLLQKVNRDTYNFAQKASAILVGREWVGINKSPITGSGKVSKKGRVIAVRELSGEIVTVDKDKAYTGHSIMKAIYIDGLVRNYTTLAQVRERCKI